jgi:glucose/arabinose dehydrogenase
MKRRLLLLALAALMAALAPGQSSAQLPPPKWVQMFDQGESNPQLAGISTPRGIKLEVVAEGASLGKPLAIAFGDKGTILVLQAKTDAASQRLVALTDGDHDGKFEKADVLMSDLDGRASLIVDGGWNYLAGNGTVIRRHATDAKFAEELHAAGVGTKGPPSRVTADSKWIEQTLIKGLSEDASAWTGGLAQGLDGAIYLSIGGAANRAENWDGSKATVLGSGAIFRFQPDGSKVQEFARGFATVQGPPTIDGLGNCFQADKSPAGARIVHVLEGGDFDYSADLDPDKFARPGTLPSLIAGKSPTANSLVAYRGNAFPKFFQGLLLAAGAQAGTIHAFMLEPGGNITFAVRGEFDLLKAEPAKCSPQLVTIGPDGAIYVVDARAAGARILRMTWSGTKDTPAIEAPALAAVEAPPAANQADRLALATNKARSPAERAAALGRASRAWDKTVLEACTLLLADENVDIARLAVEAIGDHLPEDKETQQQVADTMQQLLISAPLPVRRSLYIALGKLGTKLDTVPEWIFEATSVTPDVHTNEYLFEAHVRAAEMPAGWATELLIGNLEVALFDVNPEPQERVRLKKFVVATAEQMRTRELANFLDKALDDDKDYFSKLEAPLQARLLTSYQHMRVEPAIHADAVATWLEKHPQASA